MLPLMKYMLLIYGNDDSWQQLYDGDTVRDEIVRGHRELTERLVASGEFVASSGLTVEAARTVRVRDGLPTVTDGPFTEAKEVLAGYYLVDCADVDRATEIAAQLPEAAYDLVEVRRAMDPDGR